MLDFLVFLVFSFLFHFEFNFINLVITFELKSFLLKLNTHFFLPDILNILSLRFLLLDFKLLFVKFSFLFLNSKILLGCKDRSFGLTFCNQLLEFAVSDKRFLPYFIIDFLRDFICFLSFILSKFCLKIFEKWFRWNYNILDFACLKPHAPPCQKFLHFFIDSISELLSVSQNLVDS